MALHRIVKEAVDRVFKGETVDDTDEDVKQIKALVAKGVSTKKALKEIEDAIKEHAPHGEMVEQLNKLARMVGTKGGSRKTKRRHNRRRNRTQKHY